MAHRQWNDGNSLANKGKNEAFINYQTKYEQMSKQQQLIEQKKQEIQLRLEEKKKKETEEALKKLNEDKLRAAESSRSKRNYYGYSKSKNWPVKEKPSEILPSTLPANIFKNDGSFFEQFQKLSGIRVEVKRKNKERTYDSALNSNGNDKKEGGKRGDENINSGDDGEKEEKKKERRWSSPERTQSSSSNIVQSQITPQQSVLQMPPQSIPPPIQQIQHPTIPQPVQQQMIHPQQQMFTSQMQMPVAPPMFNPPQYNPMQMMLPPPMAPSSIPPPAPMNPGSIPSPSPLQPCSIPSPSPLQPYAIPPPSPLMPHSIPPPSPMIPHSIPPPSPLTPHSIPPPLPLRPQNIPPPVQRPPMFLSMVPPPPPPPLPEEEEQKKEEPNVVKTDTVKLETVKPDTVKTETVNIETVKTETIEENVNKKINDLFKNEDYSSSEEEESHGKRSFYDPSSNQAQSDSDLEYDRKSLESNSNKESDGETYNRMDSISDLGSERGQESQPVPETESEPDVIRTYAPVVIEDTQTQFPSDTKGSSNNGDPAPPDLSSEADTRPGPMEEGDSNLDSIHSPEHWQEVKEEQEESFNMKYEKEYSIDYDQEMFNMSIDIKGVKQEVEEENSDIKFEVKEEPAVEGNSQELIAFKTEEPPQKKKRRSRWATSEELPPNVTPNIKPPVVPPIGMAMPKVLGGVVPPIPPTIPTVNVPGMSGAMISKVTRTDPALVAYAMKSFGRTNLTDAEWKKAEDHYKINLLYQDMMRKREELQRLEAAGKNKYEYDSDEETEGGTWEHKLRSAEMEATQRWADELTEAAKGKHHIGDFLPPDELSRFMEKYEALKEGREPDLSDYKEFKLREDNVGFQMLQKLGWTEGQGLGPDGGGMTDPVNKATMRPEGQGLGVDRPEDVDADDDEYDAYRKRMMLAYRFRPNPMNNPRRPYY